MCCVSIEATTSCRDITDLAWDFYPDWCAVCCHGNGVQKCSRHWSLLINVHVSFSLNNVTCTHTNDEGQQTTAKILGKWKLLAGDFGEESTSDTTQMGRASSWKSPIAELLIVIMAVAQLRIISGIWCKLWVTRRSKVIGTLHYNSGSKLRITFTSQNGS